MKGGRLGAEVGVLVEATAQVRDPAGGQPVHHAT
jgi:hypothetical protein